MRRFCIKLHTNSPLLPHRPVQITRHMHKYLQWSGQTCKWGSALLRCWQQRIVWNSPEAELAQTWFYSKPWHAESHHIYRRKRHSNNAQTNTSMGFIALAHFVWVCLSCQCTLTSSHWKAQVGFTCRPHPHCQEISCTRSISALYIEICLVYSCFKVIVHPKYLILLLFNQIKEIHK